MFGKKTITIMIALAMFTLATPPASAETVTRSYDLAFGTATSGGAQDTYDPALSWQICSTGWYTGGEDAEEPFGAFNSAWNTAFGAACTTVEDEDGFNIGAQGFETSAGSVYTSAVVSTSDDNFDSTYMAGCVRDGEEAAENFCRVHAEGCGTLVLNPGFLFGGNDEDVDRRMGVFMYTTNVDADTLEVCLGSSGSVTAVFS